MKAKQVNKIINYGIGISAAYFIGSAIAGAIKRKKEGIGAVRRRKKIDTDDIYMYILYPLFLNDEFIEWYYWEYKYDESVARLIKTQEELDATLAMIDGSNLSPYKKNWLKEVIKTDYQYPGERMSFKKHLENAEVFDELD